MFVQCSIAEGARAAERIDPAGLWSCVIYGDPSRGDERTALLLTPEGQAYSARQRASAVAAFRRLDDWEARGSAMRFVDPLYLREFEADLRSTSLGGRWEDDRAAGGWWCARRPETMSPTVANLGRPSPDLYVPQVIPDRMFSPRYPIEAIRNATEGHAVVCFVVDPTGAVVDPEVVETTDEVFAEPVLRAITRSRYRPSTRAELYRPGCRQFRFELKIIYDQ